MTVSTPAQAQALRIGVEEAISRLESGQPVLVLDVRSPEAWESGCTKVQGAIRIPPLSCSTRFCASVRRQVLGIE